MPISIHDIDFSELGEAERILLAEALLNSLHSPNTSFPDSHKTEIDRRLSAAESGKINLMTREELHKRLANWDQ